MEDEPISRLLVLGEMPSDIKVAMWTSFFWVLTARGIVGRWRQAVVM
jgi:hypothetical protein